MHLSGYHEHDDAITCLEKLETSLNKQAQEPPLADPVTKLTFVSWLSFRREMFWKRCFQPIGTRERCFKNASVARVFTKILNTYAGLSISIVE